jgi:hypothetical protein
MYHLHIVFTAHKVVKFFLHENITKFLLLSFTRRNVSLSNVLISNEFNELCTS